MLNSCCNIIRPFLGAIAPSFTSSIFTCVPDTGGTSYTYSNTPLLSQEVLTYSCISTGIDDNRTAFKTDLIIYPNPSSGKFMIVMNGMLKQVHHDISVYDMIGKKIFVQNSFSEKTEINLSNHPNGIYFVSVRDGENNLAVRKIVKM